MVKCKVCGKTYKKITSSHVSTHSLTMEEYNALPDTPVVKETAIEEKTPMEEPTKKAIPKEETPKIEAPTSLEDDELEEPKEKPEREPTIEKKKTSEKKEAEKPLVNCATCGKPILRGQPVIHQDGKAYHGYASCHHSAR